MSPPLSLSYLQVTVTADNPTPNEVKDAAVFGFVFDEEATSVVANNPDGASDAGEPIKSVGHPAKCGPGFSNASKPHPVFFEGLPLSLSPTHRYSHTHETLTRLYPPFLANTGQFAIIDKIPKGSSRVSFQFVAAIEPGEDFDSKKLKFKSLKAISYAGGKQYGAITECEMNPLAAECDFD